jgi:hypothetical protein
MKTRLNIITDIPDWQEGIPAIPKSISPVLIEAKEKPKCYWVDKVKCNSTGCAALASCCHFLLDTPDPDKLTSFGNERSDIAELFSSWLRARH